jgi:hypothetical protein
MRFGSEMKRCINAADKCSKHRTMTTENKWKRQTLTLHTSLGGEVEHRINVTTRCVHRRRVGDVADEELYVGVLERLHPVK